MRSSGYALTWAESHGRRHGTFASGMLNGRPSIYRRRIPACADKILEFTEYPPVLRTLANFVLPLLSFLPTSLKKLVNTNFTSADQAAGNGLKLVLDRNGNF